MDNSNCSGFLGSLSPVQLDVLAKVKQYMREKGFGEDRRWTDWNLLRFCRARKFELKKVIEMIDKFIAWFYPKYVNIGQLNMNQYEELRDLYAHGYYAQDKQGRPIYIEQVSKIFVDKIFERYKDEELNAYYVQSYERLVHIILPECSRAAGRRVEQTITIMDLKDVSIMSLFAGKVKTFVDLAIKIAQDFYPEIMGTLFILNSGFFFSAVWTMLKVGIDKKTQEKIKIINGSGKKELADYIDLATLPTFLGGNNNMPLKADHGPWHDELVRSRQTGTVFHSNPALVEQIYPSPFK